MSNVSKNGCRLQLLHFDWLKIHCDAVGTREEGRGGGGTSDRIISIITIIIIIFFFFIFCHTRNRMCFEVCELREQRPAHPVAASEADQSDDQSDLRPPKTQRPAAAHSLSHCVKWCMLGAGASSSAGRREWHHRPRYDR